MVVKVQFTLKTKVSISTSLFKWKEEELNIIPAVLLLFH